MSHLRNLFHKPSEPAQVPAAARVAMVSGSVATSVSQSFNTATATPSLPEFPVEEAQLRPENHLVCYDEPHSPGADRFRLLRMRLKTHWTAGRLKKLLITGPLAHDGKSTVVLNLATALAERGKRSVLVVEADLHHSSLAASLRLKPWAGLSDCLVDSTASPLASIRRIEPLGWHLLPAGEPRKNATELMQSPVFGHILEQLAPCFDWILIDSPPVIPLTDSISIQQHVDASLLVVRAGQTSREAVEQSIELLGKKNILGILLNGVEVRDHLYYQYHGTMRQHED